MQYDFTLFELPTYWANGFLLNCLQVVLNVTELLQPLADMYVGWFLLYLNCLRGDYILTELSVYWMSKMLLNCNRHGDFTLSELSTEWLDSYWIVCWVILLYLNCLRVTAFLLNCQSTKCLECFWTVEGSSWNVCGWFYSILTVYGIKFWYILTELSIDCIECCWTVTGSKWSVCRVILLYLNCLLVD